jgi:YfiH family protein
MLQKIQHGIYTFSTFIKFPELICAISTRKFGNLKFAKRGNKFLISSNFQKFTAKLASGFSFIQFEQVHGSKIAKIGRQAQGGVLKGFDGGVTKEKNLFLAIFVADCFPILAYDPVEKVIGIAHAGWRGIKSGIGHNLIAKMEELDTKPYNLVVGIAPAICGQCYEVGKDVAVQFNQRFLTRKDGKRCLDLGRVIEEQLIQSGIKKENIEQAGICVFENKNFFSARREGETGRIAVVIGKK